MNLLFLHLPNQFLVISTKNWLGSLFFYAQDEHILHIFNRNNWEVPRKG